MIDSNEPRAVSGGAGGRAAGRHGGRELRLREPDALELPARRRGDGARRRLESVVSRVGDPETAVFNFHCPPYDTGIDAGPKLSEDLRLRSGAGGVDMHPVGSTACRAVIERYQPLLGLHGHLHESRGTYKLGPTVGINPGSEYNEGVLRGALIEIKKGKLKSHQFTTG